MNQDYVEIKDGCVRLYDDGRVRHWDGGICCWRQGWGVFGSTSSLGEDWRKLVDWRKRTANRAA